MDRVEDCFTSEKAATGESVGEKANALLGNTLQRLGIINAEGKPVVGDWSRETSAYVINNIEIVMCGKELILQPYLYTRWHGRSPLQSTSFNPEQGPEQFNVILSLCVQQMRSKQAAHETRVYGNEW
ncbi:MAG: hypothetical protein Q7R81_04075 [Candidatus Peregrinibacteria bacterium]|nr:hypothetical protein [Candidatus Peregrinibacteria bacterium]